MRRILILGLGALCLLTFTASQANALMAAPEPCETNEDCPDAWVCEMECDDVNDSEDAQCEGFCQPEPEPNKNDCEVDADCPTGFECHEYTSKVPTSVGTQEPGFAEPPCPEGEECEGSGSDEGDPNTDPVPPQREDEETENTMKTCTPKMCDTDADCGGDLLCVLETYECPSQLTPDRQPMSDCADGEDCGEGAPEEEESPPEAQEPCEPETVGHCAPKWLAPCEADGDCGPGFTCEEAEMCWESSGGSTGSKPGAPDRVPCDPDDEDCGDQDSSDGFAPDPAEGEGEGEELPSDGCESTGEFYCELQIIDCSTDECPEGLVCISVDPTNRQEDCAVSSDDEMDCPESEEQIPEQLCVPEDFEDWAGAGAGAQSFESTAAPESSDDDGNNATGENGDGATSGSSSGSDDSGCAGGNSSAPLSTLALALLALGLVTRRRV
jgi:hypothetical protein